MIEYSKDCPLNENIEEKWRLISEILNTMADEYLGTKNN
jgi:uncharacterized protein YrzB (UPF0473 family)